MNALILMTRIPIAGKTKTRLMEIFTGEQCAELQRCFLKDLFKMLQGIREEVDIYVTYTPGNALNLIKDILPVSLESFPQEGQNLGDRMDNAIQKLLKKGYSKVVLIGSDIPALQEEDIKKAYDILEDKDICLGPTNDGGYYLVGMKKSFSEIFDDSLKWGKKSVFERTVSIANNLGVTVGCTTKLTDIDEKSDIIDFMMKVKKGEFNGKLLPINTMDFIENKWGRDGYDERCIK